MSALVHDLRLDPELLDYLESLPGDGASLRARNLERLYGDGVG